MLSGKHQANKKYTRNVLKKETQRNGEINLIIGQETQKV